MKVASFLFSLISLMVTLPICKKNNNFTSYMAIFWGGGGGTGCVEGIVQATIKV